MLRVWPNHGSTRQSVSRCDSWLRKLTATRLECLRCLLTRWRFPVPQVQSPGPTDASLFWVFCSSVGYARNRVKLQWGAKIDYLHGRVSWIEPTSLTGIFPEEQCEHRQGSGEQGSSKNAGHAVNFRLVVTRPSMISRIVTIQICGSWPNKIDRGRFARPCSRTIGARAILRDKIKGIVPFWEHTTAIPRKLKHLNAPFSKTWYSEVYLRQLRTS